MPGHNLRKCLGIDWYTVRNEPSFFLLHAKHKQMAHKLDCQTFSVEPVGWSLACVFKYRTYFHSVSENSGEILMSLSNLTFSSFVCARVHAHSHIDAYVDGTIKPCLTGHLHSSNTSWLHASPRVSQRDLSPGRTMLHLAAEGKRKSWLFRPHFVQTVDTRLTKDLCHKGENLSRRGQEKSEMSFEERNGILTL